MEFDLSKKHCFFFNEILKIPHGSRNEKEISDFIVQFAKDRNLEYKQDEVWNVIVYKNGSEGRENEVPLVLQAHIDMVCEKNNDVEFDFDKEGIKTKVVDGWLCAQGTTLGADDGAGASYILSILDDNTLSHPPIVGVFTSMEEIGLLGAKELKAEDLRGAKRMVNLDGGGEVQTTVSNSGGQRCVVDTKVEKEENTKDCYRLFVTGLKGGHSGGTVHLNRGNSNKVLARALNTLVLNNIDFNLVSISGGLKENAIPREAEAVIACDTDVTDLIKTVERAVQTDLSESDNVIITLEKVEKAAMCMTSKTTLNVVTYMECTPNGFIAPSLAIPGLTLISLNMGVVRTYDEYVEYSYSIRSPLKTARVELMNQMRALARVTNSTLTPGADYPGWMYEENSSLRELLKVVLKEMEDVDLICRATHGGLETGYFKALEPEMDIVTYGPISSGAHTPEEKLDLASFDRAFEVLKELIKRM